MEFFAQQSVNGVVLGSVYALYALGFGLVIANLKIFHVAHAGVFTWGAVFAWLVTERLGLPLAAALPVAAVLSGIVNVMAYVFVIRHLLSRRDTELAAFVSSLGALVVLEETARLVLEGTVVRIPRDAFPITSLEIGPVNFTSLSIVIVATTALLVSAMGWIVMRTEFGRELRAVAHDRETAAGLGVNVDRVSAGVFFLSGAIAGCAAILVALAFNVISAELGSLYMVIALAAMVVGGFGSIPGILLGGLTIGLASTYATGYADSTYRDLVVFALLMVFLVVRPNGIIRTTNDLERV